jgi:hypothetical protein
MEFTQTYQPMDAFIHGRNTGKFENILKKAGKYEMNSFHTENYLHYAISHIRDERFIGETENTLLLQSVIRIQHLMPEKETIEINDKFISDLGCGRMSKERNENYKYYYEYLLPNIQIAMQQGKHVFIQFGFIDYAVDYYEDGGNAYDAHSTCLMILNMDNNYQAYYFNSHGDGLKTSNFYSKIVSRKRKKTYKYVKPLDIIFIENFIRVVNSVNNGITLPIVFENTNKYVYYGANLQEGDYEGVCFVYPQIVWYYFGKYFTNQRVILSEKGNINIPTGKQLLQNGQFDIFIYTMFIDFSPALRRCFINQMIRKNCVSQKTFEKRVAELGKHFTKPMLRAYVEYLTQDALKNKITQYYNEF